MWYLDELRQIAVLLGGKIRSPAGEIFGPFSKIVVDSRVVEPGDIFIALKGETSDGHLFLNEAIRRGAKAVVISRDTARDFKIPCMHVKDTLEALHMFGRFGRYRTRAKIVAVTGSVGKTTTKDMVSSILGTYNSPVAFSPLSFNNHVGVPLSLSVLEPNTKFGVFELGMNHPGEIAPLSEMVAPHVAVITSIAEAHIGHMGSLKGVTEEKSNIFNFLDSKGTALIPSEAPYADILLERARAHAQRTWTVGKSKHADLALVSVQTSVENIRMYVKASIFGEPIEYDLPFIGEHHVWNTLFTLGVGIALELNKKDLIERLSSLSLVKGRGMIYKMRLPGEKEILLIDDSYNANPESMLAGLESLKHFKPTFKRVVAVLGDMLELGEHEVTYHQKLANILTLNKVDLVFTSGILMKNLFSLLPSQRQGIASIHPEDLLYPILDALEDGDVLFIKGSKGSRVASLVQSFLADYRLVA